MAESRVPVYQIALEYDDCGCEWENRRFNPVWWVISYAWSHFMKVYWCSMTGNSQLSQTTSSKHLNFHCLFCTRTTLKGKGVQKKHRSIKYNNTYASPKYSGFHITEREFWPPLPPGQGLSPVGSPVSSAVCSLIHQARLTRILPPNFHLWKQPGQAIHKVLRALML